MVERPQGVRVVWRAFALLIGIAARALLGLIGGGTEGRRYRVTLFAILTVVLYEFVEGTFSIALGFAITMLIPLLITVHGLGRLPWRAAREMA